jgi:hypothetical protein
VSVLDGKKAVGEIELPLRSSKRTQFEEIGGWGTSEASHACKSCAWLSRLADATRLGLTRPRAENRWALQGKEAQGTLHLTVKYRDVNSISKPAQFVKEQSVTTAGGTIITSNLSPEWAKVLTTAGDLPIDPQVAATPHVRFTHLLPCPLRHPSIRWTL